MTQSTESFEWLMGSGRCLGMHQGNCLHASRVPQRVLDLLRIEHLAPGGFNFDRNSSASLHNVRHPAAEHTIDADDHSVPRLNQVDEGCLHAG